MKFIPVLKNTTHSCLALSMCIAILARCFLRAIFTKTPENFGLDTAFTTRKGIDEFQSELLPFGNIAAAVDSGGYDLAAGTVHPYEFSKFLDCVLEVAKRLGEQVEILFTLDLQHFRNYPELNTPGNILGFNEMAIAKTKKLIAEKPGLQDRYFFVWQGRTVEQFNLWLTLVAKQGCEEVFRNHGVGGMVRIAQVTRVKHSPFVGLAFRCFQSIFNTLDDRFNTRGIHLLGISSLPDRFVMAILERLFNAYLGQAKRGEKICFSSDSATPLIEARYGCRNFLTAILNGNTIRRLSVFDLPEEVIRTAYPTQEGREVFSHNYISLSRGERFLDVAACVPLAVYGLLQENRFIEHVVDSEELVKSFWNHTDPGRFQKDIENRLNSLNVAHPGFFRQRQVERIAESCKRIFVLHKVTLKGLETGNLDLDPEVRQFIEELKIARIYND